MKATYAGDPKNPWSRLRWTADDRFIVGDITFELVSWGSPKKRSSNDRFVLVKDAPFAASMARLLSDRQPRRILEFGIYQGASLVLLDLLYQPELIIGIDERVGAEALDNYVQAGGPHSEMLLYYDTKQDDQKKVRLALAEALKGAELDLVIDDCSHLYAPSKIAFETAFPHLAPGGMYIIEDWGWAHWDGDFQKKTFFDGTPLSQLVFELLMMQATRPDLIDRIEVDFHHVAVVRGHGSINAEDFGVEGCFRNNVLMTIPIR